MNWRTTLIGAILAALTFLGAFQANGGNLNDWKLWAIPAAVAALGVVAKDAKGVQLNPLTVIAALMIAFVACFGMTSCVTSTAKDGRVTRSVDREQVTFWSILGVKLYQEIKRVPPVLSGPILAPQVIHGDK